MIEFQAVCKKVEKGDKSPKVQLELVGKDATHVAAALMEHTPRLVRVTVEPAQLELVSQDDGEPEPEPGEGQLAIDDATGATVDTGTGEIIEEEPEVEVVEEVITEADLEHDPVPFEPDPDDGEPVGELRGTLYKTEAELMAAKMRDTGAADAARDGVKITGTLQQGVVEVVVSGAQLEDATADAYLIFEALGVSQSQDPVEEGNGLVFLAVLDED